MTWIPAAQSHSPDTGCHCACSKVVEVSASTICPCTLLLTWLQSRNSSVDPSKNRLRPEKMNLWQQKWGLIELLHRSSVPIVSSTHLGKAQARKAQREAAEIAKVWHTSGGFTHPLFRACGWIWCHAEFTHLEFVSLLQWLFLDWLHCDAKAPCFLGWFCRQSGFGLGFFTFLDDHPNTCSLTATWLGISDSLHMAVFEDHESYCHQKKQLMKHIQTWKDNKPSQWNIVKKRQTNMENIGKQQRIRWKGSQMFCSCSGPCVAGRLGQVLASNFLCSLTCHLLSVIYNHLEVSIVMGVPLYRWMVYKGKSIYKWMMTGGTPHFRKPPCLGSLPHPCLQPGS